MVDKDTGKARYMPMETFPLEGDPLPAGKDGWLLFLDEMNSAPIAVQAAAYKLVLDRAVGQNKLHPQVAIMAAGNKEDDNAIVNRMGTAMQSRMVHINLKVDFKAWLAWAASAGIDHRITSFINYKPDNLSKFNPNHSDATSACSRTWEFCSRLIAPYPGQLPNEKRALIAGTISEGMAAEFFGFCKIYKSLPTVQDIISNPTKIKVPEEPSQMFALSGSIANHIKEGTAAALMSFVERMPLEFQVITLQEMLKRNKEMIKAPSVTGWVNKNARELF